MALAPKADDVISRLSELQGIRVAHEAVWQQIRKVAAPDAGPFHTTGPRTSGTMSVFEIPHAAKASVDIYDTTAIVGVDRLASGIEAMICPQNEYWHNLGVLDLEHEDNTNEEKRWLERLRNLLFRVRYDADSGWTAGFQTAVRRCVGFGNGFLFVEEGFDSRALTRYRALPLEECFVADDHLGRIDTFFRPYTLTARQAVQKFGDSLPAAIHAAAKNANEKDKRFNFIHAIGPREDWGQIPGVLGAPFYSVHVSIEETKIVRTSGYHEFPVIDFRWLPEPGRVYGEGPVQKCLADIQSLNVLARNELLASQQAVQPPLLVPHAGVMNRPNTDPGQINFGGLSPSGQELVKPLSVGQRLDFATLVRETKANQVKDCLYLNLFQTLVQNPQMTATEALIRAQEKGDLLGPAGGRLQQSLSNLVERELGILARKGVFAETSAYRPPPSLEGREVGVEFTSPLDRVRRAGEARGVQQMLELLNPLMTIDPEVADVIDGDETSRGLSDVLGVPARFIRSPEKVEEKRAARAQQQQLAAMAETAKNFAQAGKFGSEALANAGGIV